MELVTEIKLLRPKISYFLEATWLLANGFNFWVGNLGLRRDIGGDYAKVEIERIFEKFLNIQAFVRSQGEKIHVTYYRYPSELVSLFQDLNEKLKNKGINPAVPWLNNKTLEFHFK